MKKMDWLFGAFVALLGLLFICIPKFWICTIVIILGLGSIAYGIYNLVVTRKLFDNPNYRLILLIKSIVSIVIGLVAVLFPMAFGGAVWTGIVYVLVIYLVVAAALGFYSVTLLKECSVERKRYVLENLTLLAIAILLLLISPNKLGLAIIRIIGILVMVVGIILAVVGVKSKNDVIIVEEEKENSDSQ